MTISLINRTNKIIVFGEIILNFLDTGDCHAQPCAAAHIRLCKIPAIDAYNGRTGQPLGPENPQRSALDWKPAQTIEVHVGDYMDEVQVKSGLSNFLPVTGVSKVAAHLSAFFFEDGMRWGGGGGFALPDPERRGRFKYLSDDYFPGKRGQNWPPGYNQ